MSACTPGFIYQNLNWMIPWYVSDYVELNKEQEEQFTKIIDDTLAWHKEQELPRYRQYLQNIYAKLDQPLKDDDIIGMQEFTNSAFKNIQQRISPTLLPLFKTLNADQQKKFWRTLNEQQVEYEKQFLPRSRVDYVNDLNEKYTDFSEKLLGFLTADQKSLINNSVRNGIRTDDIWLNARRAWISDVKNQYEQSNNNWHSRVQTAWLNRDQHYSTEDKLKIDERDQQARQLLLTVINSRSDKQTKNFKKLIRSWQSKFTHWEEEPTESNSNALSNAATMGIK
jgi:hypothetical protein